MLAKELIAQPQSWQLVLEVSTPALSAVAFSPTESHTLIHEEIPLDCTAMPHLQALEDAVYNNPMLLLDFKSVQVIYDTPHFMPLPAAMSPIATQILTKAFPAEALQRAQIVQNQLGQLGCDIAFAVPEAEMGFINRTFHNATIIHPLTPLASWMRARHPNRRRGKTLVNLRPHRLDLIILGDDAPLTINSYSITCAADALYYILAARQTHRLPDTDEIFIAGERELRAQTSALLRRYVRFVMPVIFPSSMFRAGRAAFDAPFEAIVAPLMHTESQ